MNIECLASSSAANCYILKSKETTLMVEAGLDFKTTRSKLAGLGLELNYLDAVVITHKHGDHCNLGTVKELARYALIAGNDDVMSIAETKHKLRLHEWKPVIFKTIRVTPFNLDHDVPAFGYIFEDLDSAERILFINDTAFVRYNLKRFRFSKIMIECNHILDLVDMNDVRARRQIQSHLSLEGTIKALKSMDLMGTNEIMLMHLSDSHSDEKRMIDAVQAATGIPTYACGKNGGYV